VFARWIERDSLLAVLAALGFGSIRVLDDQIDHPAGPSILLIAEA